MASRSDRSVCFSQRTFSNSTIHRLFRILIWISIVHLVPNDALHVKGTWKSDGFFNFLAKFGFQQTNMHDRKNTQGYIYGNITSKNNITNGLAFVVVDSEYFLEYYGNRSIQPRTNACPAMFHKIDTIAWDYTCNPEPTGREDFIRHIPCPKGELCIDEDAPANIVPDHQFTYAVQDINQPRYWYVSMVACYRNTSDPEHCWWNHNDENIEIDYDIWLVNGNPFTKHINPFEHQFSFELHDVFELYLAFFVVYTFLLPIQLYALSRQKHVLPFVLTACISMEYIGIILNFIHVFKFAFDGEGVYILLVTGNFIDQLAQCLFMLLLLLIVKGWTITRMDLTQRTKAIMFTIWTTYTIANMALFIWNQMEIDEISGLDEWQTWPGYLILIFRLAIMVWFLLELRETFLLERSKDKMRFYLHFGAGYLVWFVYLPILAVIGTQVSALWRHKTILSVMHAADFLSYAVLIHLLWPTRSYLYFNLKTEIPLSLEELEFTDLHDDVESTSEDSADVQETAKLLRGKQGSHDREVTNHRQSKFDKKTVDWLEKHQGARSNLTNGEPCDSGIESLFNGDSVEHHANTDRSLVTNNEGGQNIIFGTPLLNMDEEVQDVQPKLNNVTV